MIDFLRSITIFFTNPEHVHQVIWVFAISRPKISQDVGFGLADHLSDIVVFSVLQNHVEIIRIDANSCGVRTKVRS